MPLEGSPSPGQPPSRVPDTRAVYGKPGAPGRTLRTLPELCDNLPGVTSGFEAVCQTLHIYG